MARTKVKPLTKILGLVAIGVIVWFGFRYLNQSGIINQIAPQKGGAVSAGGEKLKKNEAQDVIKVCVVTWGGYAGGQFFNGGFKASKESRYYKEYGILL
ncbi:MAG: hypothetical protein JW863_23140 [Chitinispirillaceae bacterium]|nr:hypothetical protein [Chitinispirillaceae bacterium]